MKTPSADLFEVAFDSSPAGQLVVDDSGAIVLANRAAERLFGYAHDELLGQPLDVLVPERCRSGHARLRQSFQAEPRSRHIEAGPDLFGLRKDGTELPIEIGLDPVRTPEGVRVLATVVDISARRTLEAQLRQAQKLAAVGMLAGGIAHDFNNLLRSIIGYSELVTAVVTDGQALADLEQVRVAAARGQDLVLRMLAFSRPSDPSRAAVRLHRPTLEAVSLLRSTMPSLIEIRYRNDAEVPAVRIDPTQLQQVLMNLVTNGAQAIGDASGSIEVALTAFRADHAFVQAHPAMRKGLYARLSVIDSGVGMTAGVRQHAFEPFFTTKPAGKGTGLGLSVVHGIVQGAGGCVDLQSRQGEGTQVDVYLPAASSDCGPLAMELLDESMPLVLFVDDEEAISDLGRRQLVSAGFRVAAFSTSLTALEEFRRRPTAFSVVVTDNTMPRMSGLQFAQEVHSLRPDIPILLVSGLVDTVAPAVIHQKGIAALLRKPHTGTQLIAAVRALTEARG